MDVVYKLSLGEVPRFASPVDFILRLKNRIADVMIIHEGEKGQKALLKMLAVTEEKKSAEHIPVLNLYRFALNSADQQRLEDITEALKNQDPSVKEEGDATEPAGSCVGDDGTADGKKRKMDEVLFETPKSKKGCSSSAGSSTDPKAPSQVLCKAGQEQDDAILKATLAMFQY